MKKTAKKTPKKSKAPRGRLPLTSRIRPFASWKPALDMLATAEREVNGLMVSHGLTLGLVERDSDSTEAFREAVVRVVAAGGFDVAKADRIIETHDDGGFPSDWNTLVDNYSRREEAGFFIGLCVGARLGGFR